MSFCKEEGQHRVIFMTKEDDDKPISDEVTIEFDEDDEPEGLIRADGSINWECPCLGNMISGPCGVEVREFFSCFHESNTKEDSNPSDCIDQMRSLDKCMSQNPELYPRNRARDEEDPLAASASAMELEVKNGQNGDVKDGADNTDKTADGHEKDAEKKSL